MHLTSKLEEANFFLTLHQKKKKTTRKKKVYGYRLVSHGFVTKTSTTQSTL